ncbi:MAG: hypothetical protein M1833_002652 [Piccolia ochrophora]|nr:MAG: hypothetical protein M1833_002652 [Piccolia ochrophora]
MNEHVPSSGLSDTHHGAGSPQGTQLLLSQPITPLPALTSSSHLDAVAEMDWDSNPNPPVTVAGETAYDTSPFAPSIASLPPHQVSGAGEFVAAAAEATFESQESLMTADNGATTTGVAGHSNLQGNISTALELQPAGDPSIEEDEEQSPQLTHATIPYAQLVENGMLALSDFDPSIDMVDDDGYLLSDFEQNLDFIRFVQQWYHRSRTRPGQFPRLPDRATDVGMWTRPLQVLPKDLNGEAGDLQGIDWTQVGVTRETARRVRRKMYNNYTNLPHEGIVSCPIETVMDLRKPRIDDRNRAPIKITTMTASHGVIVAGGFTGEYAMSAIGCRTGTKHIEGLVTEDDNGITNHVHTFLDRSKSTPNAVFCSNDKALRVLDCYSNTFVYQHEFSWPVNCAATSPDGRLRVIVGDTKDIYICEAESGRTCEVLPGHRDYGFACAWADDGYHVATANQDMQVRIYDARNWRRPIAVLAAEVASVRALRFSPVGGGRRVLLMSEPADSVSVVDATLWDSKQSLDQFGEIAGIDFTPDGSRMVVGNADLKFGGIAEYHRVGHDGYYGNTRVHQECSHVESDHYDPEASVLPEASGTSREVPEYRPSISRYRRRFVPSLVII